MLFDEIYGVYYKAAGKMIAEAQNGSLDAQKLYEIVGECAFPESGFEIEKEIKEGHWSFLEGASTPIRHVPKRPWTTLEKRWLKTILLDPRIKLFWDTGKSRAGREEEKDKREKGREEKRKEKDEREETDTCADIFKELSDVEPLYLASDIVYYDRYRDGDPYTDADYIARFHCILEAFHAKRRIMVDFLSGRGRHHHLENVVPWYLEYSDRDDKFRLYGMAEGRVYTFNLARIQSVALEEKTYTAADLAMPDVKSTEVVFLLKADTGTDSLERGLMQFCHYKKEVTREKEGELYKVRMQIDRVDEKDVVIQLLSFGPYIKLLSPQNMVDDIRQRIQRQADLFDGA